MRLSARCAHTCTFNFFILRARPTSSYTSPSRPVRATSPMPIPDPPSEGGRGPDIEESRKGLLGFDGIAGAEASTSTSAPPGPHAAASAGGGGHAAPTTSESWAAGALHLTAAVVGVGILSLPHCMAALGPGPGAAALTVAGGVSLYTALLLARLGAVPELGRPPTYADLADRVLHGAGGDGGGRARAFVMALQGVRLRMDGVGWMEGKPHFFCSLTPSSLSTHATQPSPAWAWPSPTPSRRAPPWRARSRLPAQQPHCTLPPRPTAQRSPWGAPPLGSSSRPRCRWSPISKP